MIAGDAWSSGTILLAVALVVLVIVLLDDVRRR